LFCKADILLQDFNFRIPKYPKKVKAVETMPQQSSLLIFRQYNLYALAAAAAV